MLIYRIVRREVPHRPAWFVIEERRVFPWPRWRVMRKYVCTGFDIEPVEAVFDTAASAEHWLREELKGARQETVKTWGPDELR